MQIYKSSIIKYLKSMSTWIPLLVSIGVVIGIGVIMPFVFLDLSRPDIASTYQIYTIVSVSTIASAVSLFSATFAAFKATQIYKNEIEEGTFLVLISKPITRKRIIFEKWLALITILVGYTAIIISFYDIFILILDPGKHIKNLTTSTISQNIGLIGIVLFFIILMITILFSSIALLISAYFSSASTIATVAGLGALIPVSGIMPTFAFKNDLVTISKNIGSTLIGREPTNITQEYLNKLPSLDINQKDKDYQIDNLFKMLNDSSKKINNSEEYINNIALSSGEKNIYKNIFFLDFYYQLNQISSIATDYLWGNVDRYSLVNSSYSSFTTRPDVIGKKTVINNDIQINEMINRINNTLNEWEMNFNNLLYKENFYRIFNIILKVRNVPNSTKVVDESSYKMNLLLLIKTFIQNNKMNVELFNFFIQGPIINSILNSNFDLVSEKLKADIKDRNKPIRSDLRILETIFLSKILFDLKLGNQLLFLNSSLNNYYFKNNLQQISTIQNQNGEFVLDKNGQEYFDILMSSNNNFKQMIDKYFKLPLFNANNYNFKAIAEVLNILQLKDIYNLNIKSITYEPYANKWVLFSFYALVAFSLIPIAYLVIKKQNIR